MQSKRRHLCRKPERRINSIEGVTRRPEIAHFERERKAEDVRHPPLSTRPRENGAEARGPKRGRRGHAAQKDAEVLESGAQAAQCKQQRKDECERLHAGTTPQVTAVTAHCGRWDRDTDLI